MNPRSIIEAYVSGVFEQASPHQADSWSNLLARINGLYTMYYTSHWKSKGSNYYGDHLLYERLYKATFEDIDGIAEKAIGTTDDDSFISPYRWAQETASYINSWDTDESNDNYEFPDTLLNAERDVITTISSIKSSFEARGYLTDGIDDFLQGLASKHEGHVYLLQQRRRA